MSRRRGAKPQAARAPAQRPPLTAPPARAAPLGWLPHPRLSVLLAVVWLLLQHSLALPQLITAALLGWAVPRLVGGFLAGDVDGGLGGQPGAAPSGSPNAAPGGAGRATARPGRLGPGARWWVALRLAGGVLWDIVVSNLAVARRVLSPRALPQPAWVVLPLTLHHPDAIALLATVITMTPGTVSCVVDERARQIVVHVLAGSDPAALVVLIKHRYERPIGELFE